MSIVDIIIITILLISTLIGVFRGFIRELLSLLSWVLALYVAWIFAEMGATYLVPYLPQAPLRVVAAFTGIFIIVLILASIVSYVLYRLFAIAGISGLDRSLGLVFGIARGVVIVAILIIGSIYMDFTSQPWWQGARLVSYFTLVTDFILTFLPAEIAENLRSKTV